MPAALATKGHNEFKSNLTPQNKQSDIVKKFDKLQNSAPRYMESNKNHVQRLGGDSMPNINKDQAVMGKRSASGDPIVSNM